MQPREFDYEHATLDEWLKFVFEECVDEHEQFTWIPEPQSSAGNANMLRHCIRLFRDPAVVIRRYSEATIAGVLWAIPGIDAFGPCFADQQVDFTLRAEAVDAIYDLYDRLFRHYPQGPIEASGFMWWEHLRAHCRDERALAERVLALLERLLRLPEPHIQRSALHGLNEFWDDWNAARIGAAVDHYLNRNPHIDPELRGYALLCREGAAQ